MTLDLLPHLARGTFPVSRVGGRYHLSQCPVSRVGGHHHPFPVPSLPGQWTFPPLTVQLWTGLRIQATFMSFTPHTFLFFGLSCYKNFKHFLGCQITNTMWWQSLRIYFLAPGQSLFSNKLVTEKESIENHSGPVQDSLRPTRDAV